MAPNDDPLEPAAVDPDFVQLCLSATPTHKGILLINYLERHSGTRLMLARPAGDRLDLSHIDLSQSVIETLSASRKAACWFDPVQRKLRLDRADFSGVDLRGANLEGCILTGADLSSALLGNTQMTGVCLEGANLFAADLAGSVLRQANLGGATLREALLEEADLSEASLRFANLTDATLERAMMRRADLWGAVLDGATMVNADLHQAILCEATLSRTNLTGARLTNVNAAMSLMRETILRNADLRGSVISGTAFDDAILSGAFLQELDFSSCTISHVHLSGARLTGTRLERDQFDGALGEDIARDFGAARKAYLGLEQLFLVAGDPDAASWAYKKRRRMQKLEMRSRAADAFLAGRFIEGLQYGVRYSADLAAEVLCDYGESIPRVLATMTAVYLGFCLIYGLSGSIVRTGPVSPGTVVTIGDVLDLAVFSLLAMTTSGAPAIGLLPRTEAVQLLTGMEALCGIFLTGLLGFVVGNRIRR